MLIVALPNRDAEAVRSRLTHLLVQHTPDHACWVSLPQQLISQLYEARARPPLVLELQVPTGQDPGHGSLPQATASPPAAWLEGQDSGAGER